MDKSSILQAFNNHFEEFIGDVRQAFPDNTILATTENALLKLRKMNPKIIITTFTHQVVNIYREQINNGDITFFITKDYRQDLHGYSNEKMILDKIDILREPIRNMGEDDKQKVVKYLQNLMQLSDLYMS